ncbi:ABC-2 family transporter protein [soil metagenome]|jgi:ABC-2 type transport system permease protein
MADPARRLRRAFQLLWLSIRLGALNALQYRVEFVLQLVQSSIALGTALAGLALVFSHTDNLAGWRPDELLALVGVFQLVAGLVGLVIRPSMEQLMEGVRLGTLDFTLTKPADAQLLVSVRRVNVWRIIDVLVGAGLILFAVARIGERVGPAGAASFVLVLLAGMAIIYSFLLTLSTLSFWLVRLENILVIYASMYEAGRWPVGIYPIWLRIALTFVVPVAFAITVPVEALVGRLEPIGLVGALALAAAFLIASRLFWRFGLRHYTGASA